MGDRDVTGQGWRGDEGRVTEMSLDRGEGI